MSPCSLRDTGLTYGRCALSNLRVTPGDVEGHRHVQIRVDVRTEGARVAQDDGAFVVRTQIASVMRLLLELKGSKIDLRPGEAGTVTLSCVPRNCAF